MNYVRHLNAFFSFVRGDKRLTSSHVSLYMALFHYWNLHRFQNPISVSRQTMMQLSKIGSKTTYYKCIKDLHQAQYILCHPAISKYHSPKISIIPLDNKIEESGSQQIDLFNPNENKSSKSKSNLPLSVGNIEGINSTDNGTPSVPIMGHHLSQKWDITCPDNGTLPFPIMGHHLSQKWDTISPDNGTLPVPIMGHYIKLNNKRERETPTQKIFDQNKKIQKKINELAHVPNMGHVKDFVIPGYEEVIEFFKSNNYSSEEANKFFNHYKALGWMIQGKTPIHEWQPLVHKWMGNENRWNNQKTIPQPVQQETDLKSLQQMCVQGKKVFHLITADHFHELHLSLTDTLHQKAWQERMNQLTGSNNFTTNQLLQAYETGNAENELVKRDHANLLTLAKRIAVINHFKAQ
jgi:hypothetical protein